MCLRWMLFCCDSIVELVGKCEEVRLGLIRSEETPRTGIWQVPLRLLKLLTALFVPRLIGSSIGIWSRKSLARLDDGHLGNTGLMSLFALQQHHCIVSGLSVKR